MNRKNLIQSQNRNTVPPWTQSVFAVTVIIALIGILIPEAFAFETRTIDGNNNNVENPLWGSANSQLLRYTPLAYQDGIAQPSGADRPNAREISNTVAARRARFTTKNRPQTLSGSGGNSSTTISPSAMRAAPSNLSRFIFPQEILTSILNLPERSKYF